ncbi:MULTISPECIES: restriction endonuclease subunit S [Escherichia]|uniref:restriction endonuclease subunit S n=1 Tax=Escherichia TaxID=561 RepID=UPI0002B9EF5A|nr:MULTISPECIES: restriction endonuclease subunit S [Escherichia]EFB2841434.1 restriction endonuclease subunit S [Escherichia coli]EFJ2709502.1 restriction endonuclease subunit S [Escherichia coli]EHS3894373.1 restriction endonuclease subunit S [Escherichia coli]EHS4057379.1 restriction endonuclease subunit S [Escherichia coli]EHW6094313.1 restriction endonuclease subunit S [Escherichia coli]
MSVEKLIVDHMETWTSALQTRSTAGRGSSGKIDLYGIKKLRELILELAVRGKLVPQDPNDEPASELLKRIAAEKAELVKQGKIKKQKPLPEISEEEKPFELPQGWEWVRLGDIAEIIRGVTYGKSQSSEIKKDGMLPLLRANNIQSEILLEPIVYVDEELVSPEQYLRMGDVLIAMSSGSESLVGKAAQFFENGNYTFGAFCGVVRTYSKIIDEFIGFFLKTPLYRRQTQSSGKGIGIKNLNKSNLEMLLVAMPSKRNCAQLLEEATFLLSLCDQLEQQSLTSLDAHQQLVETLLGTLTDSQNAEELAENWARISEHFDTLFTTEASVDTLKQTILQLAVMGKLVPQDPNDEPASELLKRIAQEKAQLVKEGKIKKQKPLPPIRDEEKPFELPKGWEWCRLGDLALKSEAGWSPQCENEPRSGNQWGVLKISAVTWGEYRPQENKALPAHLLPRQEYEVKENDFLISRANTSELVARSVVVPENPPINLMLSDKIIRFEFSSFANPYYINLVNNSVFSRKYYKDVAGGTSSSMKNVSRNQVSELVIALPCYKEQLKITETLKQYMKICEELSSQIQSAQQTQLHLADALTDAAIN